MLRRIRHLAKGQRVAIGQKHGIVSETLVAAWRPDKGAGHRGVEFFKVSVGPGEAERANELRLALATRVRAAPIISNLPLRWVYRRAAATAP